jgi:Chaperone of endosialidase
MKKSFYSLIFSLLVNLGFAQSTEIRPGNVLPKMTTAQRTAIASPQDGMLVFDSNTQSYWYRKTGTWTELPQSTAAVNFWQQTGAGGNEIKNTNSGGFWSANPTTVGLSFGIGSTPSVPTSPVNGAGTRLMWIPSRSAFRVGTVSNLESNESTFWDADSVSTYSFASGFNTKSKGTASTAMGFITTATNTGSFAIGNRTKATGDVSTAMGYLTQAKNFASTSLGSNTIASGEFSTSLGDHTKATGQASIAGGGYTEAVGTFSSTFGSGTIATATSSMAIGDYNNINPNGLFMVGNGDYGNTYTNFIIRKDNNRVGINKEDPLASLHVGGYGYVSTGQGTFFYPNNTSYNFGSTANPIWIAALNIQPSFTANIGILADEGIVSKTYVGSALNVISSDSRIKKDFTLSNNSEDLERLRKIQITNYRMKDVATWGDKTFKKVIAQQVEEVYPEVINKTKSVIPDIYALAESVAFDADTKNLRITLSKDYTIKVGEKLELVHPEKGKIQAEVVAVNGKTFIVKDWNYATDKIFVFGREVNDFRSVDYEALSMLGISAIQQLAKEIDKLQITNLELQASKVKTEARLEAIENLLKGNMPAGK